MRGRQSVLFYASIGDVSTHRLRASTKEGMSTNRPPDHLSAYPQAFFLPLCKRQRRDELPHWLTADPSPVLLLPTATTPFRWTSWKSGSTHLRVFISWFSSFPKELLFSSSVERTHYERFSSLDQLTSPSSPPPLSSFYLTLSPNSDHSLQWPRVFRRGTAGWWTRGGGRIVLIARWTQTSCWSTR